MKNMKKALSFALTLSLLFTILTSCTAKPAGPASSSNPSDASSADIGAPKEKASISVIGATSGGTFYLIANSIAQTLNTYCPDRFAASGQASAGGMAMLRMLNNQEGEFGMTMGTTTTTAYNGWGVVEEPFTNIRAVTYLYDNVIQIVATKSSGITSLADLKGKSFCVGTAGSGTYLATQDILAGTGLDFVERQDFRAELTNESQSVELLKNGQVDAALLFGPISSASMLDIMSDDSYVLFGMTTEEIAATIDLGYGYYEYTIPANTYTNQSTDIVTVATANMLLAGEHVPDDVVYDLLTGMYDHIDDVHAAHSAISALALDDALTGIAIPLHPGAEQFYTERGIK